MMVQDVASASGTALDANAPGGGGMSFAMLCQLISEGRAAEVPGVQQIPDQLNVSGLPVSSSTIPRSEDGVRDGGQARDKGRRNSPQEQPPSLSSMSIRPKPWENQAGQSTNFMVSGAFAPPPQVWDMTPLSNVSNEIEHETQLEDASYGQMPPPTMGSTIYPHQLYSAQGQTPAHNTTSTDPNHLYTYTQ